MPYEIIHDTIARLVYDKSSAEARTRRKIEREIRERYIAFQERNSLMSQEDLDFLIPWLDKVNITDDEFRFLAMNMDSLKSKAEARAKRTQRNRMFAIVAIAILMVLLIATSWSYNQSQDSLEIARHNDSIAQANAKEAGIAKDEAFEALSEADKQRIIADNERGIALFQKGEAETQKNNAEREALNARIALHAAEQSDSIAQLRAVEAQAARLRAVRSDSASQVAALLAEAAAAEAKQASIEARSSALAAQSRQYAGIDPTLGFQLAFAAKEVFAGVDANSAFQDMIANDSAFARQKVQIDSRYFALSANSDKQIIATIDLEGTLEVRSMTDGEFIANIPPADLTFNGVSFAPDGENLLVSATHDSKSLLILYDQEFKEMNRVEWVGESMSSLACGQRFIAAGTNTGEVRVYSKNLQGGPVLELTIPRDYDEDERVGVDYDPRFLNPIALLCFDYQENKTLIGGNYNEKAFLLGLSDNSRKTIRISKKIKKAMEIRFEDRPLISVGNGMFLPNDEGFIISYPLHGVVSFDKEGGNQAWIPLSKDGFLKEIALSKDGKDIYLVQENGLVTEIRRRKGEDKRNEIVIANIYKVGNEINHLAISDGNELIITTVAGELYFFDTWRTDWGRFRVNSFTEKANGRFALHPIRHEVLILDNLRDKREGVALTNLQVYMDRLWRMDLERQGGQTDQIVFDESLVKEVGVLENVLSDFLDEQMVTVEKKLKTRGVENVSGLPLEILFTLVTDDGTKRNVDVAGIRKRLPKHRKLSQADVEFCLTEFHNIRLLRELEDV